MSATRGSTSIPYRLCARPSARLASCGRGQGDEPMPPPPEGAAAPAPSVPKAAPAAVSEDPVEALVAKASELTVVDVGQQVADAIDVKLDSLFVSHVRQTSGSIWHVDLVVVRRSHELLFKWCASNLVPLKWESNGFLEAREGRFYSNNYAKTHFVDVFVARDVPWKDEYDVKSIAKKNTAKNEQPADYRKTATSVQEIEGPK